MTSTNGNNASSSEDCLQKDILEAPGRNIFKQDQDLLKQNRHELVPPDGGWGWFVLIGGFISTVCAKFPFFAHIILLSSHFSSTGSASKVAWSMSIYAFVFHAFTLFVGPLCAEFGWRRIAIAAGISSSLSFLLSAFISNPDVNLFIYPVFAGIGGGTSLIVCQIVVSRYFLQRRGFALASANLGACTSMFISPLIANYLLEFYGYKGASLICGALVLHQCIAGALFQPVERHLKLSDHSDLESDNNLRKEKLLQVNSKQDNIETTFAQDHQPQDRKLVFSYQNEGNINVIALDSTNLRGTFAMNMNLGNISSQNQTIRSRNLNIENKCTVLKKIIELTNESLLTLKFMRVKILCIGVGFLIFGSSNFQMWIPLVITNAGYSLELSAWCVSIYSAANLIGRLLSTLLSDQKWFNVIYVYNLCTFSVGLFTVAFAVASDIKFFVACIIGWGFLGGLGQSIHPVVLISVSGEKMFPSILGVTSLTIAIIQLTLGPVIGIIRDATSSYIYSVFFMAASVFVSFVAFISMPLACKYDKEKLLRTTSEEAKGNVNV